MNLEKDHKEWNYQRSILEAILFFSTSEESLRLPTIEEFILSEIINATIEYVGGNAGQIKYNQFRLDRTQHENKICNYFKSEIELNSKRKLNPKIQKSLLSQCEVNFVDPEGPGKIYIQTGLYIHFKGYLGEGICPRIMQSIFSFPQEIIIHVQKEILPSLSKHEIEDLQNIGKIMRKYIDEDINHIQKHIYW